MDESRRDATQESRMMQDGEEYVRDQAIPQSEDMDMGILDRMYGIEGRGRWLLHGDMVGETEEGIPSLDMNELCIGAGPGSVGDLFRRLREQVWGNGRCARSILSSPGE